MADCEAACIFYRLAAEMNKVPLIGLTYAFAGTCWGLLWLRRKSEAALRALSAVMLAIAALNGYIELWPRWKSVGFETAALLLVLVFLWPYSLLSIRLMESTGVARGKRAFFSSQLPVIYLLFLGMVLVNLHDLSTFDDPPLAMYIFMVLVCVLHVPAFVAGKTRMAEYQAKLGRSPAFPGTNGPPSARVRSAGLALATTLFIALVVEGVVGSDWLLLSLDAALSGALALLFLISSGRGWKSLVSKS